MTAVKDHRPPETLFAHVPRGHHCPPLRSTELPSSCTPENNQRMKAWLLERYASSTFNTCPHWALPCMDGPPFKIHVHPGASPKASHTPATIPILWQKKVYEDLLCDEALGEVECLPYGAPVTWCHPAMATISDSKPSFQSLNGRNVALKTPSTTTQTWSSIGGGPLTFSHG